MDLDKLEHKEIFEYVFEGPKFYDKEMLDLLNAHIKDSENILDIGSGPFPFYWFIGVIDRIDRITFSDMNQQYLSVITKEFDLLSPERLEEQYGPLINHLNKKRYFDNNLDKTTKNFLNKLSAIKQLDVSKSVPGKSKFSCITSFETLNVLKNEPELGIALKNLRSMLDEKGYILGYFTVRGIIPENFDELEKSNLDSSLHLDINQFRNILVENKFKIEFLYSLEVNNNKKYPSCVYFKVR